MDACQPNTGCTLTLADPDFNLGLVFVFGECLSVLVDRFALCRLSLALRRKASQRSTPNVRSFGCSASFRRIVRASSTSSLLADRSGAGAAVLLDHRQRAQLGAAGSGQGNARLLGQSCCFPCCPLPAVLFFGRNNHFLALCVINSSCFSPVQVDIIQSMLRQRDIREGKVPAGKLRPLALSPLSPSASGSPGAPGSPGSAAPGAAGLAGPGAVGVGPGGFTVSGPVTFGIGRPKT